MLQNVYLDYVVSNNVDLLIYVMSLNSLADYVISQNVVSSMFYFRDHSVWYIHVPEHCVQHTPRPRTLHTSCPGLRIGAKSRQPRATFVQLFSSNFPVASTLPIWRCFQFPKASSRTMGEIVSESLHTASGKRTGSTKHDTPGVEIRTGQVKQCVNTIDMSTNMKKKNNRTFKAL